MNKEQKRLLRKNAKECIRAIELLKNRFSEIGEIKESEGENIGDILLIDNKEKDVYNQRSYIGFVRRVNPRIQYPHSTPIYPVIVVYFERDKSKVISDGQFINNISGEGIIYHNSNLFKMPGEIEHVLKTKYKTSLEEFKKGVES